jgi:hypothetical protein
VTTMPGSWVWAWSPEAPKVAAPTTPTSIELADLIRNALMTGTSVMKHYNITIGVRLSVGQASTAG